MKIKRYCKINYLVSLTLLIFTVKVSIGQNSPVNTNSILRLTFAEILNKHNNDESKEIYALAYIKKAKKENDLKHLVEGYDMMINRVDKKNKYLYYDSLIPISKQLNDFEYPAKTYIKKARFLGFNSRFLEAMKTLIIANKYASENGNLKQKLQIKYMIGLLKIQLGEYSEGVKSFGEIDTYYDSIENQDNYIPFEHINTIFGMAYGYISLKEYDSARKANQKAINLSLKYKDSSFYQDLLVSSAMTSYYRKEYKSSIDSIKKYKEIVSPNRSRYPPKIMSELFLGHIAYDHSHIKEAERYYKHADSLIFLHSYFHPEIRNTYEKLIKIKKKEGDIENQLFYMNRLLYVDSILGKSYKNVLATLNKEYTTPKLLEEKQKIIYSFEKKYKETTFIAVIIICLFVLILFYWYKKYKKNKIYKERFEMLMKEKDLQPIQSSPNKKEKKSFDLPDKIESELLVKLEVFEQNLEYLNSDISINKLSKRLETNSRYLSIVINKQKSKSFQNYINELRINYALERLKSEEKFRRYTISAIANECGFNTTQAFALSFKKNTGINPSYFLKSLEKEN